MRLFFQSSLLTLFFICLSPGDEFELDSIKSIMRKTARWGLENCSAYGHNMTTGNDWSTGTFHTGNMGVYRATGENEFLDNAISWAESNNWQPDMGLPTHPDNMSCMQTYCELYIVNPVPENTYRYQTVKEVIDEQLSGPVDGAAWFYWEDGLYMGPPIIAMLGHITGEHAYFDHLTDIWFAAKDNLYNTEHDLWHWRNDPDFKTTPGGNPEFWGPGNAWVMGGLIRILKYMPEDYAQRDQWTTHFQAFAAALLDKQQPDGFWRTSLYEPTEYPDPESSSTAFFTYGFSLGVQYGLLDAQTYTPAIEAAWSALVTCVDDAGKVGRGQPWSHSPGGVPEGHNIPEGQGAFMLAAEGVHNLLSDGITGTRGIRTVRSAHPAGRILAPLHGASFPIPAAVKGLQVLDVSGRAIQYFKNSTVTEDELIRIPAASGQYPYVLRFQ